MHTTVIGLNHRSAPVKIREQLALSGARLQEALALCKESKVLRESILLSTCNRVELYAFTRHHEQVLNEVLRIFARVCGLSSKKVAKVSPHFYSLHDRDALRHIFRVASSLDSMVVGESQILGQLKDAAQNASETGTVGPHLSRVMDRAFSIAKRVRTETGVSKGSVSVAYVASQLAAKIFGDLSATSVLLVGAGEMAELAARNLAKHGARRIAIANRSPDRARELASRLQGVAHPLEALPDLLLKSDIVISSTGSSRPILHKATLNAIARTRKYRPLFIIDIAVPRDVEPSASEIDGVYLYDVDDLSQVVAANEASRMKEARAAEKIVEGEVVRFLEWLEEASVVPVVVAMRERAMQTQHTELEKTLARLQHLDERDQKLIRSLAQRLTNKFLHTPSVKLRKRAARKEVTREQLALIRELFEIEDLPPAQSSSEEAAERSASFPAPAKA